MNNVDGGVAEGRGFDPFLPFHRLLSANGQHASLVWMKSEFDSLSRLMNYKRKKNRTKVRCSICTPNRLGNVKRRFAHRDMKKLQD